MMQPSAFLTQGPILAIAWIVAALLVPPWASAAPQDNQPSVQSKNASASAEPASSPPATTESATESARELVQASPNVETRTVSKASILVGSFTVFLLAVFVGFEVITKVPPTLHTPLMSGSNAISGITIVGAILTAGHALGGFGSILGMLAVVLAMVNVVGGFLVTYRMLMMFKKR